MWKVPHPLLFYHYSLKAAYFLSDFEFVALNYQVAYRLQAYKLICILDIVRFYALPVKFMLTRGYENFGDGNIGFTYRTNRSWATFCPFIRRSVHTHNAHQ